MDACQAPRFQYQWIRTFEKLFILQLEGSVWIQVLGPILHEALNVKRRFETTGLCKCTERVIPVLGEFAIKKHDIIARVKASNQG